MFLRSPAPRSTTPYHDAFFLLVFQHRTFCQPYFRDPTYGQVVVALLTFLPSFITYSAVDFWSRPPAEFVLFLAFIQMPRPIGAPFAFPESQTKVCRPGVLSNDLSSDAGCLGCSQHKLVFWVIIRYSLTYDNYSVLLRQVSPGRRHVQCKRVLPRHGAPRGFFHDIYDEDCVFKEEQRPRQISTFYS